MKEDYVSFDVAKFLKEKGFDGKCLAIYYPDGRLETFDTPFNYNIPGGTSDVISAPTLQMAMKWLREIHKIQLWAEPYEHEKGQYNAYVRAKWFIHQWQGVGYKSNEEACEEAIKYCLENLV